MRNPTWSSVVYHPLNGVKTLPFIRDVEGLEDVGEGGVVATDPGDGSLQVQEALLLQTGSHARLLRKQGEPVRRAISG